MSGEKDRPNAKLGNLMLVWRFAGRYPGHIAAALFFLVLSSAATLAIPYGFKRVIDPRRFRGEISITSALRARRFVVLKLAHRFHDEHDGLAHGTVTMALGEGKPMNPNGGEAAG